MGLGGYYTFDAENALLTDGGFEETDVFNGFGLWSTIGFSYALTDDIGFSVSINALSDFSANALTVNTSMLSFGFYVRLF
jgi:outer membrane protein W